MTGDSPTDSNGDATASAKVKAAQPQRQLDILREHRPYCPYVVRSTVLPTFPAPPSAAAQQRGDHRRSVSVASMASANSSTSQMNAQPGTVEGWRAVMAVVSRYGNVQRQRLGLSRESGAAEGVEEGNSVETMVAGVKRRGVCRFSSCLRDTDYVVLTRHSLGEGFIKVRQGSVGLMDTRTLDFLH